MTSDTIPISTLAATASRSVSLLPQEGRHIPLIVTHDRDPFYRFPGLTHAAKKGRTIQVFMRAV
jgi:hypothetical protein